MTDDSTPTPDEEVEPSAIEQEGTSPSESPEEPQDAGALKRALEREREERKAAKEELRRIREDEDARRELLAEWGYEVADDEPEDEDEFDDEPDEVRKELSELKQWQQAREQERRVALFEADLKEFAGERQVSDHARDWIAYHTARNGDNRKALEKAVGQWFEFEDSLRASGREDFRQSKKAPHQTSSGKSATKVPDLDDDEQRVAWMTQRAADLAAAQDS